MRINNKHNIVGRTTSALLLAGIVSFIVMFVSIFAAFATINSDQDSNNPNSVLVNSDNVAEITNNNVSAVANTDKKLEVNFDVFKSSYKGNKGTLVIESNNEEKVVALGANVAEDESMCTIKNSSDVALDVNCDFSSEFDSNTVPLEFKMVGEDGQYYVGSPSKYDDPTKINGISTTKNIQPGQSFSFKFPWRWDFYKDDQQDIYDTSLGNITIDYPVKVALGVQAYAEVPEPTEAADQSSGLWPPQTNDVLSIALIAFVIALVIVGSIGLYIHNKKRKKERKNYA